METRRLRDIRLAAVITQAQLAEKAGVTEATVVAAEKGRKVRISTVRKLAQALGVTPQELVNTDPKAEVTR
jgi:transcriptional regulator with XRE-family HTH domain